MEYFELRVSLYCIAPARTYNICGQPNHKLYSIFYSGQQNFNFNLCNTSSYTPWRPLGALERGRVGCKTTPTFDFSFVLFWEEDFKGDFSWEGCNPKNSYKPSLDFYEASLDRRKTSVQRLAVDFKLQTQSQLSCYFYIRL